MREKLHIAYRFLPIQLALLHLRKYQLLLAFWLVLVATITGHFARHFGAATLFLSPEYLGNINFLSMFLLGCAMAIFMMAWNITTFIIHSNRIPFLGATRQAFLKYCINNALIPICFLVFYSIYSIGFQWHDEHATISTIITLQLGFYIGFILILLLSFFYFFRVDRDLLKIVLSHITNPARIREIIPYDSLDVELDIIRCNTYLSETLHIEKMEDIERYHPRLLNTVLRRHHRNAIAATIFALALLLVLGAFMENPYLRIPAGSGFLILFAVAMGIVGAVKYFLKTWELMGWVMFAILLSILVRYKIFDLRSIAYGLNYHTPNEQPIYNHESLQKIFNAKRYAADKQAGQTRLDHWLHKFDTTNGKPPLVVISVSGGGSRAAYWTFRTLQYLDSSSKGALFQHTALLSGASGGMIGAAYWRSIHHRAVEGKIKNPYNYQFQKNVGKDLLNTIVFSLASVDLISPFNKISIAGYSYTKDRGYAMEQELISNTQGVLDNDIGDFKTPEATAAIPQIIINGTIVNDGRRLMMSAQPISFLCRPVYTLGDTTTATIDAVDFATFFAKQDPYHLQLTTALRMNATFPYVLPVVRLPSLPAMNIMDAGLRDNFGMEVLMRYLYVYKDWIRTHTSKVIFIEIRDTKEYEVFDPTQQNTLNAMLADPLFVIQNKWEPFQSNAHTYLKDFARSTIPNIEFVTFSYIPEHAGRAAALNFHITQREQQDLYESINIPINKNAAKRFLELLYPKDTAAR